MFSCLDVFGVGIEPCRSDIIDKGSGQNRPRRRSVLTLWYQVEENYGIKLNISYAASGGAGEEGASDNIGKCHVTVVNHVLVDTLASRTHYFLFLFDNVNC